jgi:hypothetical protein
MDDTYCQRQGVCDPFHLLLMYPPPTHRRILATPMPPTAACLWHAALRDRDVQEDGPLDQNALERVEGSDWTVLGVVVVLQSHPTRLRTV